MRSQGAKALLSSLEEVDRFLDNKFTLHINPEDFGLKGSDCPKTAKYNLVLHSLLPLHGIFSGLSCYG
ncbi:hypothetical protein AAE478_006604 [Parahypoxylon ruwenzoriense]